MYRESILHMLFTLSIPYSYKGFNATIIPTANIKFFVIIKSTCCIKSYDMSNQDNILLQNEQDPSNI